MYFIPSMMLSIHAIKLRKTGDGYVQRIVGVAYAHCTSKYHLYIPYDVCNHFNTNIYVSVFSMN